jgi:hypothetical protein
LYIPNVIAQHSGGTVVVHVLGHIPVLALVCKYCDVYLAPAINCSTKALPVFCEQDPTRSPLKQLCSVSNGADQ